MDQGRIRIMLKTIGFFISGILLLAAITLYLIRPQSNTKTPLIQKQPTILNAKPQQIISNTELAALNIQKPVTT